MSESAHVAISSREVKKEIKQVVSLCSFWQLNTHLNPKATHPSIFELAQRL